MYHLLKSYTCLAHHKQIQKIFQWMGLNGMGVGGPVKGIIVFAKWRAEVQGLFSITILHVCEFNPL